MYCPLPYTVCAYRKNLSMEHAILKFLDTIYKNNGQTICHSSHRIDLSATFNTYNPQLITKGSQPNI